MTGLLLCLMKYCVNLMYTTTCTTTYPLPYLVFPLPDGPIIAFTPALIIPLHEQQNTIKYSYKYYTDNYSESLELHKLATYSISPNV